jgi:hypothetical protein
MSDDPLTSGVEDATTRTIANSAARTPEPNLPIFRFSLRQLLVSIAFASVLLATIAATTMLTAAFILLVTTIAAGHVFATVLGNRLQARAKAEHSFPAERPAASPPTSTPTQRSSIK